MATTWLKSEGAYTYRAFTTQGVVELAAYAKHEARATLAAAGYTVTRLRRI